MYRKYIFTVTWLLRVKKLVNNLVTVTRRKRLTLTSGTFITRLSMLKTMIFNIEHDSRMHQTKKTKQLNVIEHKKRTYMYLITIFTHIMLLIAVHMVFVWHYLVKIAIFLGLQD